MRYSIVALLTLFLFEVTPAAAITIGGVEYDEILTLSSQGTQADGTTVAGLSYWWTQNKFGTARFQDNPVSDVLFADDALSGVDFGSYNIFGMVDGLNAVGYRHYDSDITFADIVFRDSNGDDLLTLSYRSGGTLEWVDQLHSAGSLGFDGFFEVTGGSLFDDGLLSGLLFLDFSWDNIYGRGRRDVYSNDGTLRFYRAHIPPDTEVPEPATACLLGASILGLITRKKRT